MKRDEDLQAALNFVIGRITEEAALSGEPLTDEQILLLNYLPTPESHGGDPESSPIPRNLDYERVCALGKTAYLNDRRAKPASRDWEFAFAVFALNRHLMWGLLHEAGVKRRRSLSDQLLLILSGVLFMCGLLVLVSHESWGPRGLAAIGSIGMIAVALLYLASLRIERRRLEKDIERFRLVSRFASGVVLTD